MSKRTPTDRERMIDALLEAANTRIRADLLAGKDTATAQGMFEAVWYLLELEQQRDWPLPSQWVRSWKEALGIEVPKKTPKKTGRDWHRCADLKCNAGQSGKNSGRVYAPLTRCPKCNGEVWGVNYFKGRAA